MHSHNQANGRGCEGKGCIVLFLREMSFAHRNTQFFDKEK